MVNDFNTRLYDQVQSNAPATTPVVNKLEVSVVIPCLNESQSIGFCIDKALTAFRDHGIRGEVLVSDNGSTDGSIEIAQGHGARVVHATVKGYGNALRKGIDEARGEFIIMGDADDSYDFAEVPKFVEKWRAGYEFVMGNRFTGGIKPGAMPVSPARKTTSRASSLGRRKSPNGPSIETGAPVSSFCSATPPLP